MYTDLIATHLDYLRAGGYAETSIDARGKHLRRLDRELPHGLAAATHELVAWHARPGWAPATRASYVEHTRGFYTWATAGESPWLDWDPSQEMPRPRVPDGDPKPVTDAELTTALRRATGVWLIAVILAAYAGLRAAEVVHQLREDITETALTVRKGKGGKSAALPTHPAVWAAVRSLPAGPAVGRPVNPHYFSGGASTYFPALGLPGVSLHRFRHWYATNLIRNGADVRTVQTLMRHASLGTTARYIAITDGQRSRAVLALPDLTATNHRRT